MTYFYNPEAEDQITHELHAWDNRIDLGTHIKKDDEPEPNLPEDYSACCPLGCGLCNLMPYQFFTYASWNYKTGDFDEGHYHKVYAAECCPSAHQPITVWNTKTDEDAGDLYEFLKKQPTQSPTP